MFGNPSRPLNSCKEHGDAVTLHLCVHPLYVQTHHCAGWVQDVVPSWQFSSPELSFPFPLQSVGTVLSSDIPSAAESEEDEDGMNDMNEEVMSLIWSEDLRVQEVRRLLQSARPVRVNVVQMPEASDHEYIEEKENR